MREFREKEIRKKEELKENCVRNGWQREKKRERGEKEKENERKKKHKIWKKEEERKEGRTKKEIIEVCLRMQYLQSLFPRRCIVFE